MCNFVKQNMEYMNIIKMVYAIKYNNIDEKNIDKNKYYIKINIT